MNNSHKSIIENVLFILRMSRTCRFLRRYFFIYQPIRAGTYPDHVRQFIGSPLVHTQSPLGTVVMNIEHAFWDSPIQFSLCGR